MKLRKDDPIYYKNKILDLIKQASKNELDVYFMDNILYFKADNGDTTGIGFDKYKRIGG